MAKNISYVTAADLGITAGTGPRGKPINMPHRGKPAIPTTPPSTGPASSTIPDVEQTIHSTEHSSMVLAATARLQGDAASEPLKSDLTSGSPGADGMANQEPYEILCASARGRVRRLREHVARETLAIATELLAAKRDYEGETKTGHGKRNPQRVVPFKNVAKDLVGMSTSWVQNHVRLALRLEHDSEALARLEEMADISFRLLLAFADERNAVRRLLALEAHRSGGPLGMRKALDGHPLARVAGLFLDRQNSPYAQPTSAGMILPAALVQQFPELAPYTGRTIADVVAALKTSAPRKPSRGRSPAPLLEGPPKKVITSPPKGMTASDAPSNPAAEPVAAPPVSECPGVASATTQVEPKPAEASVETPPPNLKLLLGSRVAAACQIQWLYQDLPPNIVARMLAEHDAHALGLRGGREVNAGAFEEQREFVGRIRYAHTYVTDRGPEDHPTLAKVTAVLGHSRRLTLLDVSAAEELVKEVGLKVGDEHPFGRTASLPEEMIQAAEEEADRDDAATAAEERK